jgi:hypothetical protein
MRQAVQVNRGEDAMNRRRGNPQTESQLNGSLAETQTKGDATTTGLRAGLVRRVVWPRGSVLHRLAYPVSLDPSLDRGPLDLESAGNFADRPTVIDDEAGDL